MTKVLLRRKALQLRGQGASYSQIKEIVGVSKSTLSIWLRHAPLSQVQIRKLRDNSQLRIEKFRSTMLKKREHRLFAYFTDAKKKLLPLSDRELFLSGLFLYWGEGNKSLQGPLSVSNTDPQVLNFYLFWLEHTLRIPRKKIKVYLHLYADMNVEESMMFWSKTLGVSMSNFIKPYIKRSNRSGIDQKGFGFGTCALIVSDVRLKEKIMMRLKAVADHYSYKTPIV